MNTFAVRSALAAAAALAIFAAPGVAAAAPNLHGGDPNTPGTQVQVESEPGDSNSYTCGGSRRRGSRSRVEFLRWRRSGQRRVLRSRPRPGRLRR